MSEGCWELNKPLELNEIAKNSLSVLSVFSVVNHAGIGIFENPQDRGKIHAMLGQIGRFFGQVEFQLHGSNVCRINSHVKPSLGGLPIGNANVPVGFARHVSGPRSTSAFLKKARQRATTARPSCALLALPSASLGMAQISAPAGWESLSDTFASEVSSSPDLSGIILIALNSRVY